MENLGPPVRRKVAATRLGQHRIGSTIGLGSATDSLSLPTTDFDVDFSPSAWSFEKADRLLEQNLLRSVAWLEGVDLDAWLINFRLERGEKLYVPCFEFFARCYGHCTELQRVLLTYQWHEVERRIFGVPQRRKGSSMDAWHIDLGRKMVQADAVFLSHIRYDDFTQDSVKRLYAEREALWNELDGESQFKVGPWFKGPAKLRVRGYRISSQSFLALRVDGCSEPTGPRVIYAPTEGSQQVEPTSRQLDPSATAPPLVKSGPLPSSLQIHDDRDPDPAVGPVIAQGPDFTILGQKREVVRVPHFKGEGLVTSPSVLYETPKGLSTSEPGPPGSGMGQLLIRTPLVLESKGVLLDMWNALRGLLEEYPDVIETVQWFGFEAGFSEENPPQLNAISTPNFDKGHPDLARGWCWINPGASPKDARARGILAMRVRAEGRDICILEIERRWIGRSREEQFCGLVFPLDNTNELEVLLGPILADLPASKGVFAAIRTSWPVGAEVFRHSNSRHQRCAAEAGVRNALAKMGVKISARSPD